ncbi:hypothetical protein MMPV_010020 [Pyropia vietnamensis]
MSFASTAARPVPASVTPGAVDRPSPMLVDRSGDAPVGGRGLLLPRRPLGIPRLRGRLLLRRPRRSPLVFLRVPVCRARPPTGAASAWMPVPETQVVPLADLVAQVRLLPLPVPVGEGGTLEVGPIPDESDSTGVSPSGPSYGVSRVELDPSWRSELERVIARPSDRVPASSGLDYYAGEPPGGCFIYPTGSVGTSRARYRGRDGQSGLRTELEGLLAVHDAVNWVAVATLPPYQPAQGGHPPMPRHSLRIRRVSVGEDNCHGWASTESVAGLGIPWCPGTLPRRSAVVRARRSDGWPSSPPSDGEVGAREGPRAAPAYRGYPRRGGGAPSAASRVPLAGPSGVPPLSGGVAPASASPGPAGGGASSLVPAGGSTPWHTGLDARIYQHLGDAPGLTGGNPPSDAVVGTVHAFGELLGSIRWALDNVNSGRGTLLEFRERVAHAVDSDDLFRRWEAPDRGYPRLARSTPPGPSGGE